MSERGLERPQSWLVHRVLWLTDPSVVDVRCSLFVVTRGPSDSNKGVPFIKPSRTYVALEGPKFKGLRVLNLGPLK